MDNKKAFILTQGQNKGINISSLLATNCSISVKKAQF
jgi:hypothetical protein